MKTTPHPHVHRTLNRTLTSGALLGSLLLAACASAPMAPPELLEARANVRSAEGNPAVLANAPLELKKASDSLNRANALLASNENLGAVTSAAYIANQQAKTALAIAQSKTQEEAVRGAELDRERARGDARSAEAQRANAQASSAQQQTAVAEQRAMSAEQMAALARANAAASQANAADSQAQAEQLRALLSELQAQQTERGMLITLGDVLFEFGQADVKPSAQAALQKLANFLQQNPTRLILIEGHTDNVGSIAANETLSRRRADAVSAQLTGMGVAVQRVGTVGYGEQYPIASNSSDTNRALNRRVEVYIAEANQPVKARR